MNSNVPFRQQIDEILSKHHNEPSNLLPILLAVQDLNPQNYICEDVASYVAKDLDLTAVHVSSVISFYAALSLKPRGHHVIQICKSTACLVNDYQSLQENLIRELCIEVGDTTDDGLFSLEYTECFGACDIAPAFKIGHKIYGNLTSDKITEIINQYRREP